MKNFLAMALLLCLFTNEVVAQIPISIETPKSTHPCEKIDEYPDTISDKLILARMIEGLGFRYFWVTEGLRTEDLAYEPGNNGRTSAETLDHLYNLSLVIVNSVQGKPTSMPIEKLEEEFKVIREKTLNNFDGAASYLKSDLTDIEKVQIEFHRGENKAAFPIWNLINGPVSDAIYHCGQIVSFRRSSGNPIAPGVNVFKGERNLE